MATLASTAKLACNVTRQSADACLIQVAMVAKGQYLPRWYRPLNTQHTANSFIDAFVSGKTAGHRIQLAGVMLRELKIPIPESPS